MEDNKKVAFKYVPKDDRKKGHKFTDADTVEALGPIEAVEPKQKFKFDDPDAKKYLETEGYVVFSNMADETEIANAKKLFWDWAEKASISGKLDRTNPKTWSNENWAATARYGTGVMFEFGLGQSEFLWYCRSLPKIKKAFSMIWEDEQDLLVSFDGCGVFRPPEVNPDWMTKGGWYHVDQNGTLKKEKCCIQGLLNLQPSGEHDGGFLVLPKSQEIFASMFEGSSRSAKDFFMIPKKSKIWSTLAKREIPIQKICLAPGDFIMWDSRAIHCNTPPDKYEVYEKPADIANAQLKRLVAYVCMIPARLVSSKEVIKERVKAYYEGTTTSHWPTEFQPSSYFKAEYKFVPPPLTDAQKTLITGEMFASLWKDK